jgi:sugar phosphate isomerase/epimerase
MSAAGRRRYGETPDMRHLICGRGDLREFDIIPDLIRRNLGIELQSYGLDAVKSEKEWRKRFELHRAFRERFSGYLAVHGPFIGLHLSQKDHLIKSAVHKRLKKTRAVAAALNADMLILHSGLSIDTIKFGILQECLDDTVQFWKREIQYYADAGITVALENILDETPEFLRLVHDRVNHPNLKLCLDTGHVNVWSTVSLENWLIDLGTRIAHIHLHNNNGETDQHAPIHAGTLDIRTHLKWIADHLPDVNISLELIAQPAFLFDQINQIRAMTQP